ncbi:MAG: rhomboid family intramembrane serine protease [Pseudonocardia sp.]
MVASAPRPVSRVLPVAPLRALVGMGLLTVLLYVIEFLDVASGDQLQANGILPRMLDGLDGVLWAPLLHGDWAHLAANTLPFLLFGFLVLAEGLRRFLAVTATIWVLGGLAVWLVGPAFTNHVGASGVIFGWLAFLLVRGFYARSAGQITLAVMLFLFWGGMLFGVLPGQPGVSWQGHLFGALAGVLAARWFARPGSRGGRDVAVAP